MKSIESREDIELLVNSFYSRVRNDQILGPVFSTIIPNEGWSSHLIKLTDFWETVLFGVHRYSGNPIKAHLSVDSKMGYTMDQTHFGRWLELWFTSIDMLFTGALAQRAKNAARTMSTTQYTAIWNARQNH